MTEQLEPRRDSRRKHHKSRKGCLTCKQRRIKCDEGRPQCDRCTVSNRQCSYKNANTESPCCGGSAPPEVPNRALYTHRGSFTAMDMSYLHYAECNLAEFMALQGDVRPLISVAVDNALTAPYLLDQMLALSALHCATSDPAAASENYQHATELQTRALSVFNEAKADISESNHLTSFLFATFLGIHVLFDTLANHHQALDAFISSFVSYARLHRGVRAVTNRYWNQILQSDLKPLLYIVEWTDKAGQIEPGTDMAAMRSFLESAAGISPSCLEACLSALTWVQWVLDMVKLEPTRFDLAVHATMAWPLLVTDDYIDALYQHRPEALAVLGYYAAILHRYRDYWVFKNSGATLVESITRHIGPFWGEAMAWPIREIRQG